VVYNFLRYINILTYLFTDTKYTAVKVHSHWIRCGAVPFGADARRRTTPERTTSGVNEHCTAAQKLHLEKDSPSLRRRTTQNRKYSGSPKIIYYIRQENEVKLADILFSLLCVCLSVCHVHTQSSLQQCVSLPQRISHLPHATHLPRIPNSCSSQTHLPPQPFY